MPFTNAEKVILDRIQEKNGQINLFEDSDYERGRQANELRNLICKLPQLSIFIDEVHHGNFLKRPTVKISTSTNRLDIVERGIRDFLDKYKDTVYAEGTCAKQR